jgi:DNA-directed RNA polymerase I, II, and III subunit RPABC2
MKQYHELLQHLLDNGVKNNIISEYHPELMVHNMDEVEAACVIVRDSNGVIVDRMHKTLPFVTRYEKARVLGERAKQINAGAKPFIEISDSLIDGYLIALKEFEQKKIPFIVRRPLPNGGSEYWRLRDLEILE